MKNRRIKSSLLLLISVLAWTATGFAAIQGTPPHTFYGSVRLNDSPLPSDTEITARIEGTLCGTARTDGNSEYALDVPSAGEKPGCGVDGATIHFFISGMQADQTAAFRSGFITQLDLSVSAEVPPPTSTPSATPTEVPPTASVTPEPTATPTARPSLVPTRTATARVTPTVQPTPSVTALRRLHLPLVARRLGPGVLTGHAGPAIPLHTRSRSYTPL